ncbi:hypothetical protein BN946_scf184970.g106 [Trametes cinnabarina]|uniref:Glycosyl transferase family 3 domain-containing protein n=1 Tax=Pycnoporus cinnabarinus TaxID=5643 RepID=A0A060SJ65_PYCCI|nr:hypothetical protein BN946_scf184970.g106 [Trametes cinnabarina]
MSTPATVSPDTFKALLGKLVKTPEYYTADDFTLALECIFTPDVVPPVQIGSFLTALHIERVERRPDFLQAAANVLRKRALKAAIDGVDHDFVVDIVGRGGDGHNTFDVSPTAAIVAAGAGARVVKVVLRHKLKIVWPRDIPFMNLSDLRGGVRILYRLRALWEAGSIRLEPATAEDLANAARDPRSVHPNPRLLSERPTPSEGVVVAPLAFRPAGTELGFLGVHPTSTQRAAVVPILGKRPRRQRADIKRARRRPVTNPNDLPLRRRKKGVTSTEYVLDEVSEIEEFSDGDEPAGKRMKFLCTDDPIEEFLN